MKKKVKYKKSQATRRISKGYVQIRCGMSWVFEHRLVVENFINRPLERTEVVHHIDLKKNNNKITNLMIFKSQKEHAAFHIYFKKYGWNNRTRRMIRDRWIGYK